MHVLGSLKGSLGSALLISVSIWRVNSFLSWVDVRSGRADLRQRAVCAGHETRDRRDHQDECHCEHYARDPLPAALAREHQARKH